MATGPERFGVFLAPFHALHEDPTAALGRDMDLIEQLDRLGFYEVWVGEHHSGGFEIIASPEVFIAAAAERTKDIRLGTGVKSLPYHNPRILADTMVQLDHMTKGRTMFGVGPGALPFDALQLGIEPADTRRRMDEAIDVLIPLLESEIVTCKTDWFDLREARLQLPSYTKPRMEMAVTSIRSPAGVIAAGKYGLGVLVLGGISDEQCVHHAANWKICEETANENGRKADRKDWRITTFMHIAETRKQAKADLDFGFRDWLAYSRAVLPATPIPPEVDATQDPLDWGIENKFCLVGTPDDAIREIERVYKGVGGFGTLLLLAHNWAPWPAAQKSYDLFARYVMSHFTGSRDLRNWSYDWADRHHTEFVSAFAGASQAARDAYEAKKSTGKKKAAKKPAAKAAE